MTVLSDVQIDVAQIRDWIAEAGEIALHYFGSVKPDWKGVADPVTAADREIEQLLPGYLQRTYPDHAVIGEEYGGHDLSKEYLWAIDPIDGTRSYVEGLPTWSITLGMLHRGKPTFGLVYMPVLKDWTYTDGDDVLHNGESIHGMLKSEWDAADYIFARSDANALFDMQFTRVMAFGSTATHLAYTARGMSVATFAHGAYLWDIAGGAAILMNQGGEVLLENGQAIDFTQRDLTRPIDEMFVCGHPAVTRRLLPLLKWQPTPKDHAAC